VSRTITETTTMNVHECPACGVLYAFTDKFEQSRRDDHKSFYCPNGHSLSYQGDTEADKLRAKLLTAEAERDHARRQREEAEAEARRAARKLKTLERKAAHGVCPHCKRTFQDSRLGRHIATKHPDCIRRP